MTYVKSNVKNRDMSNVIKRKSKFKKKDESVYIIAIERLTAAIKNIACRLPENSQNSFVDLQFQKDIKKNRPKKKLDEIIYFD